MNGEHMVAGSEENKRRDFTVNSIQGWELTMTEFESGNWFPAILEVVWGWWKWVLESGMGRKLISMSLWVLWDITWHGTFKLLPYQSQSSMDLLSWMLKGSIPTVK